jgi:hypothetical protein
MSRFDLSTLIRMVGIVALGAIIGCTTPSGGGGGDGNGTDDEAPDGAALFADNSCSSAACHGTDGSAPTDITGTDADTILATMGTAGPHNALSLTADEAAAIEEFLHDDDGDDEGDDDGEDDEDDDGDDDDQPGGIIADHQATAGFDSVPEEFITTAKSDYRIFYGHTSHGSQIITGMEMIFAENSLYAFNSGPGTLIIEEQDWVDLGSEGDLGWADITRGVLEEPGNDINMVMWSWCGGVSESTEAHIDAYLNAMSQLESGYPDVDFVYMTGHLDGSGSTGNLHIRNEQIRTYCRDNNKILFDFADIETYDPDGNSYLDPDGSDWCEWCEIWCATHTCPDLDCIDDDTCQHSVCFNCYRKGQAFWWMMARIAGWSGD